MPRMDQLLKCRAAQTVGEALRVRFEGGWAAAERADGTVRPRGERGRGSRGFTLTPWPSSEVLCVSNLRAVYVEWLWVPSNPREPAG
jgi:hypothetical protein